LQLVRHLLISFTDQTKCPSNGQSVGLASARASFTTVSAAAITSQPSVADTFSKAMFLLAGILLHIETPVNLNHH
jgi:hypothetical protein